jgi:ubiquinone/menaquinone biosynthesis C-methylase UbiE
MSDGKLSQLPRQARRNTATPSSPNVLKVPEGKSMMPPANDASPERTAWDHSTHENFYDYYAEESVSERARQRFIDVRDAVLRVVSSGKPSARPLDVADMGCGAGSHSMVWAELGHQVHALDVNQPLLELGRSRAAKAGHNIDFRVGSATNVPWPDNSMDICIALELLEHVVDWESCMKEFTRILRPGGALFFTTTSRLCPLQAEFNLPLYSWYPGFLKRYFEKLSLTTRPGIANFAKYPAVHWFTFYEFQTLLASKGFRCLDRFDIVDLPKKSGTVKFIVKAARTLRLVRWFGHVCTPGTIVLAIKDRYPA